MQMEKIEDSDAGDVYNELAVVEYVEDIYKFYKRRLKILMLEMNELAVVEYAEDIYKFYKEAEDPAEADKLLKIHREFDETKIILLTVNLSVLCDARKG
nr:G2/mitotic-specific cyclin S13-7-like isoform X1 [Ipomoea batatas]